MAVSVPPVEELLRIVRRYYAAGLDVFEREREYWDSPEMRALNDMRRIAWEERGEAWSGLTRVFADRYPQQKMFDWTHFALDACFTFRVYTASTTPDNATAAVLLVSILAPVHVTYTVFERRNESGPLPHGIFTGSRPETEALTRELDLEASQRMQSVQIDWKILEAPVPEVATMHRYFGEATLAELLFSDNWR